MSKHKFTEVAFVALALAAGLYLNPLFVSAKEAGAKTIATGELHGRNGHVTEGTVTIFKQDGKTIVTLGKGFSLDGAPAPSLGFSTKGKFAPASEFSKLKSLKGEQQYELPANVDPEAYDSFTVWCGDFSVSLGEAKLTTTQ